MENIPNFNCQTPCCPTLSHFSKNPTKAGHSKLFKPCKFFTIVYFTQRESKHDAAKIRKIETIFKSFSYNLVQNSLFHFIKDQFFGPFDFLWGKSRLQNNGKDNPYQKLGVFYVWLKHFPALIQMLQNQWNIPDFIVVNFHGKRLPNTGHQSQSSQITPSQILGPQNLVRLYLALKLVKLEFGWVGRRIWLEIELDLLVENTFAKFFKFIIF